MSPIHIRPAAPTDLDLLWEFLAIAAFERDAAAVRAVPKLAAYLLGWPRSGDFGFVAEIEGVGVGGAWARQFTPEEEPEFYVDDRTPEIAIGVLDGARGRGVGLALILAVADQAQQRGLSLCLNVRDTNPAIRLYERVGFKPVAGSEIRNRVGGLSIGMVL